MKDKTFNRLLGFSLFFLAHWFFGNLYEEIVLAPNQLKNSYEALRNWQGYFTVTNQLYYYVPFTQLAVGVICYLYFRTENNSVKLLLKKSGIFGIVAIGSTILIVTQLNARIFFGDLEKYKEEVHSLSLLWFVGNAIRIYLVGSAMYFAFKAYVTSGARLRLPGEHSPAAKV